MDAGLLSFVDDLEKSLEETPTNTANTNSLNYEGFKVEADVPPPASATSQSAPGAFPTQVLSLPMQQEQPSQPGMSAQQGQAPQPVPIMMVPQAQAQMGQMVMMPTSNGQMQPMMMIPMATGSSAVQGSGDSVATPLMMVPPQQGQQQQQVMPIMMMPQVSQQPGVADQLQQQTSGTATPFDSSNSNGGVFSGNSATLEAGSGNGNVNPLMGMFAAAGGVPTPTLLNSGVQRTTSNNFNSVGSSLGYTSGASNQGVFSPENPAATASSNLPFAIVAKSGNVSLLNSASGSPKNSVPPSPRETGGVEFKTCYEMGDEGPKQLIVNYISAQVNEAELQKVFEKFGAVESAKILYDKQTGGTKGYGFVYYYHSKAASKAVKSLQGYELKGKFLKVGYANPQRPPPPATQQPMNKPSYIQQQPQQQQIQQQQQPFLVPVMNPAAPSYQPVAQPQEQPATVVDPNSLFQLQ